MRFIFSLKDPDKIIKILIIFYAVGIIGLSIPATKSFTEILTPYTLLMNLALLFIFHRPWSTRHIVLYLFIALAGFFIEVAGVYTGLVFGEYNYGHVLGVKLFSTPFIIGVNWLMLIYFVYHLTGLSGINRWIQVITGALLMVTYDIILEPVAIRMNMWSWSGDDIPFQNYAAWFVISLLFLSLLHIFRLRAENRILPGLFAVQAGFILTMNIIYRFV